MTADAILPDAVDAFDPVESPTTKWRNTSRVKRSDLGLELSGSEQQRLWQAREVLKQCTKCFRNMRLYPPGHTYLVEALGEFHTQLTAFLEANGTLRLTIQEGEIQLDGQQAYGETSAKENLARRLFLDGVRELSLDTGTTPLESERLIDVFFRALDNQEVDITNLINDADLEHVQFEATSVLAQDWEPPDYLSGKALEVIESMNEDVDRMVSSLTESLRGSPLEFELTDGARETKEAELAKRAEEEEEAARELFPIPPEELHALRENMARWGPEELLVAVVDACLGALEELPAEDGGWLLSEALATSLRSKELRLLVHLVDRLRDAHYGADEQEERVLSEVLAWLDGENTADQILHLGLTGSFVGGADAYRAVLQRLGARGGDLALRILVEGEPDKALSDHLLELMGELVAKDPSCVAPLLAPEVPGDRAKSALFLLSKKAPREADLTELIELGKGHPDAKVHEYAEHLWKTLTEAGRWERTVSGLSNPSRFVRMKALQELIDSRVKAAAPILQKEIEADEFLSRDHDERHAYMLALMVLDPELAAQVLQQQTQRKSWLRNREAAKDTAKLAKDVLRQLLEGGA